MQTIDGLCGVFSKSTNGNCYSCTSSSVDLVISVVGVLCDSISNKVNEKSNKTGGCTHKPTTYTLAHDFDEQKVCLGFFVRLSSIFLFSLMYAAHFLNYRLIIFFIKCCRMVAKNLFKVLMQILILPLLIFTLQSLGKDYPRYHLLLKPSQVMFHSFLFIFFVFLSFP